MSAAAQRANSGSATVADVLGGLGGIFNGIRSTNVAANANAAAAEAAKVNAWRTSQGIKPLTQEEQNQIASIVARAAAAAAAEAAAAAAAEAAAEAAAAAQRELKTLAEEH